MTIFWTSDTHFFHSRIIQYCNRPFSSVEEMNETMISNWNSKVGHQDTVYFLGDFAFADQTKVKWLLETLNGNIHLCRGNHDKPLNNFHSYFTSVFDLKTIKIQDQTIEGGIRPIVMCHYPLLSWDRQRYQSIHLYGHCHGSIKFDPKIRRLDVGVDVHNFAPISFEEVLAIVEPKEKEPNNLEFEPLVFE
jgi:calcineurin-like phosphoesterase family protein